MLKELAHILRGKKTLFEKSAVTNVQAKEGHANFVTEMDIRLQNELKIDLERLAPYALFMGEEEKQQPLTCRATWIVDPIDGTTNYIKQRRCSCISVALVENKQPVLAAIYNPYNDELFLAKKQEGAYLNGGRIHVSNTPVTQALVGVGTSPYQPELAKRTMQTCEKLLLTCADLRRLGSAALDLADLACGRQEAFFEYLLQPWDFAAGSLIVTEAGGLFGTNGKKGIVLDQAASVLAANPCCYDHVNEIVFGGAER